LVEFLASRSNVIRAYKVKGPFGYVVIKEDPVNHEFQYKVIEPKLDAEESRWLTMIKSILIETLDATLSELGSEGKAVEYLRGKVEEIAKDFDLQLDGYTLRKLLYYIIRDYIGYGKIDIIMRDPEIEDVSCSGANVPVFVWHKEYESMSTNIAFTSEEELDSFVIRLAYRAGRMISMAQPMLDATLPNGSRIQITLGKVVTKRGSTFSIRKFREDPFTIVDLIKYNTLSSEMAAFFWYLIENKHNIFVSGATASGKTTLLSCLSNFIKPESKVVTIEDTQELQLYHQNWIRSVSRSGSRDSAEISLFDLLKAALRQRPEYMIVGEVRGKEAYTLFQAMATGHLSLSTIHANSVSAVIHRLETEPMNIPRSLIAGLDIITVQARLEKTGKPIRRTVTTAEIVGMDSSTNEIVTHQLFKWNPEDDAYTYSGRSYILEKLAERLKKPLAELNREILKRKVVLEWMVKKNLRKFTDVSKVIRRFYSDPEGTYREASLMLVEKRT